VPLFDQHLHSWNSFDCKTPPIKNIERAIDVGLSGLTFTEHFDTHPSEWDACIYNDSKIERELAELRAEFGDRVFIGKGIEVCYQPERMEFILEFLGTHEFDVVLLSVHWAFGKPVHEQKHFEGCDARQYIRRYLEAVRDATAHVARMAQDGRRPFQILGHMDFAKRYAANFFGFDEPVSEPRITDDILKNCLSAGLIPEINTSTLRNNMSAPMPGPDVIRRYAELGGTMVSLGSDAHTATYVGSHFDVGLNIMREAGIRHLAVFKGRELHPTRPSAARE
jgi:histidinol-phosphatase (PHP family)